MTAFKLPWVVLIHHRMSDRKITFGPKAQLRGSISVTLSLDFPEIVMQFLANHDKRFWGVPFPNHVYDFSNRSRHRT